MFIILALLVPALCVTLRGHIEDLQLHDQIATSFVLRDLNATERVRQPVTADGSFEFYDLAPTKRYLLSMDSDTLELPWSYLIDFKSESDSESGTESNSESAPVEFDIHRVVDGRALDSLSPSVEHPILITGVTRTKLVMERNNFSVFKFFFQPSVMLSLGALVVATYLPSWIENLDPELLEELQKNQLRPDSEKVQNFDLAKSIAERRSKQ